MAELNEERFMTMQSAAMRNSRISRTQERILAAAAGLFSQTGYKGTTTRHIASVANVNEVTIYRYYPRKRDLYLATIDAELQKVSLRGDLLADIADASDGPSALACTLRLITNTLAQGENLVRLIQYCALELNDDFDPILRHYAGELIEVISHYLEPWVRRGQLRCDDAKSLTLALIAIVLTHKSLNRVFSGTWSSPELMMDVYSGFCWGKDPQESIEKKFNRG